MKQILLLLSGLFLVCTNLFSQSYLLSTTYILTYTKTQLDSVFDFNGIPSSFANNQFTINLYKLDYLCKDAFDTLVPASGLLIVPQDSCDLPIYSYNHGTMSKKSEAPSNVYGTEPLIGMSMGSNGYLSIMPDYLGLGDGAGLHPYQHAKTEGYANVYMLKALKEYCISNNINLNNQLFLSGYSQGGHAAMATQRMIETEFNTEFSVSACTPMSGAYDMSGTMLNLMQSNNTYPTPGYLPYIVLSWNLIYQIEPNISNVFKVPYNATIPPLFDGTYTMWYIHNNMPSIPKNIFDSTYFYTFSNTPSHPLRLALHDNNTFTNWVPVGPMKMFYCTADDQVPYQNAIVAQDSLKAQGCNTCDAILVNANLDHAGCVQYALFMAKSYMDSIRYDGCLITGVNNTTGMKNNFSIYPNPASDIIYIDNYAENKYELTIRDITGRIVVEEKTYENKKPIKINFLDNGVYSVIIKSKTKRDLTKLFLIAH